MKAILSGNEAIARGSYEYGVGVATAYPGTPSTEILENISRYSSIKSSWSPNEKVALEVGFGASLGGARVLVAMKHVGVNVAADPFMTLSYTGVGGGLVLISADDPGMHSSQNEQDNRYFARMAKVPLLEPSDSQECKEYVGAALEISEQFDTPVLLRTTTRISHSRGIVEEGQVHKPALKKYQKEKEKYVMLPGFARMRHPFVEKRLSDLQKFAQTTPLNRIEWGEKTIGVIAAGAAYQYVKEALPRASILKLGFSYPVPAELIRQFASEVDSLYVVEELEPFLEEQLKTMGLQVKGKELFSPLGELSPEAVALKIAGISREIPAYDSKHELPARPPIPCPGCSHRGAFYVLRRMKVRVTGDIGCYTLGALPPLEAMDTCLCMGASIGAAFGMERAEPEASQKTVAVIGDSTFFHSGITPLLDIVYNGGQSTVLILDNSTTAMTGHQDHPGTGVTLQGEKTGSIELEPLVRGLGVNRIFTVNPLDMESLRERLETELQAPEPSVIIAKHPCALLLRDKKPPLGVDASLCNGCKSCLRLGCPAMSLYLSDAAADNDKEKVAIEATMCNGCKLCAQLCPQEAMIVKN